ncbi:hypothetical protein [Pseudodesulfovibrio sediminis]|uniref:Tail fiber protein n=1 Tax=Pseudodesulfovibrio sediminis TaxID=2810563 RepID=A0ABM7P7D3_9BACT|nr:hypothetical protein [Pseudodesulfovibrio sediminis]BCS88865.1 hypothetical protein PSDVSF_21070 [Pseudodesulfovibrio sediminis]
MTISSTETKTIYGGNGATGTFAIPFMFLCDDDIEVVLTDAEGIEYTQVPGTDYQLSGAGEQNGGTCTLTVPPEGGQILVIRRSPNMVQEVDYVENDAFPAATHEAALDKLTMICQALSERLDRTISFRVSSAVSGVALPEPSSDRFLAWNGDGDNLVNRDVAAMDALILPVSVSQGGTGAITPVSALTNLGFGAVGKAVAGCELIDDILNIIDGEDTLLRADVSKELEVGFTATATAMTTATPSPATGALQTIDTSGGAVDLGVPVAAGVIRFVASGDNALNPSASYGSIDGEYDTVIGLAQGEIVSDGTNHFLTIVNGVSA